MASFSGTLYKVTSPVYVSIHVYCTLDKSLSTRYQKLRTAMFNGINGNLTLGDRELYLERRFL